MPNSVYLSSLQLPTSPDKPIHWGQLYGSCTGLAIIEAKKQHDGLLLVVTGDSKEAHRLESDIKFFADKDTDIIHFPDWETLPYDHFSPYQDIISERLTALYTLPRTTQGILIIPVTTLMQKISPSDFIEQYALLFNVGQQINIDDFRHTMESRGYFNVPQVSEHGEFSIRGSIIDLFPMGSDTPYRLDLFDDECESIHTFDPETQRSIEKVKSIRLFPGREFPFNDEAISKFRQQFRQEFEGNPNNSSIYKDISAGLCPAGIEYYLPLFFEQLDTLFNYLPDSTTVITTDSVDVSMDEFNELYQGRYEQHRYNQERPILEPEQLFLSANEIKETFSRYPRINVNTYEQQKTDAQHINLNSSAPKQLLVQSRAENPADVLLKFIKSYQGRILFAADSSGRREHITELLNHYKLRPALFDTWVDFQASDNALGITVYPLSDGLTLVNPDICIISESQLFGERTLQQRKRRKKITDPDTIIRNLTDLNVGSPVVHEEYGVGRYMGLQTIKTGDLTTEFLVIEYANETKLYVPVAALELISRYSGGTAETAPLHRLGTDQWQRAKKKAAEKAYDVATELLEIHAKRAAKKGFEFTLNQDEYSSFCSGFPFEETPDQALAIESVLKDMQAPTPMDRVICGDVGFGKTEVAMRATFMCCQSSKQVIVLVPTTLLAQQHVNNFKDRFADWPFKIASLTRFDSKSDQNKTIKEMESGNVDIVIGTHKLIQGQIKFKDLGLVIIDEEHRFGVRHKEKLKALRTEVDLLTLTATPIPRTLNMSLAGIRELSIIASPPAQRHAVKTFVNEWDESLVIEGAERELKRGGQIYFLHNDVKTIDKMAAQLQKLVPNARVGIAHGQMRERELEQAMLDFYHQRTTLLVCSTIIESGIDIPLANTIFINRADKLGLAQLHQLRGRVGRSHHRAYAYLITPHFSGISADAKKRLQAIESLEDLGIGFTLATHDLEIRGTGELLGEGQSGQIEEIGFTLYSEMLNRAVKALKSGEILDVEIPRHEVIEIDLNVTALIPEDYIPDIHARLIEYKRISATQHADETRDLQIELIDRFGLLPEAVKNLFLITDLKHKIRSIGINKIDSSDESGRIVFNESPNIDPMALIQLIQQQPDVYSFDGKKTLRFKQSMSTAEKRVTAIENTLLKLATQQAA